MIDPTLIDLPMPITTARLRLRPPQEGDGAYIHEARHESWSELSRWGIWTWGKLADHTIENDEAFCRSKLAKLKLREDITLLIFDRQSNEFIGVTGLHKPDWDQRIFSLGFWIRKTKMRHGYANEAATAMMSYAFEKLSARKIVSFHGEGNIASQRALEKLGFAHEGTLHKQHSLPNGSLVDEVHYGLFSAKICHSKI